MVDCICIVLYTGEPAYKNLGSSLGPRVLPTSMQACLGETVAVR